LGLRWLSPTNAARFARPVADRFSRPGRRSCTKTDNGRLASCTVRFRDDHSPSDFPLGLSSIPNSPVPDARPPSPRTFRFHSPKADFQMRFAFAPLIAIPTVSRTSQSFGRLRNLPCADARMIRRASTRSDRFHRRCWLEGSRWFLVSLVGLLVSSCLNTKAQRLARRSRRASRRRSLRRALQPAQVVGVLDRTCLYPRFRFRTGSKAAHCPGMAKGRVLSLLHDRSEAQRFNYIGPRAARSL
jgi:hypothetical protein